MKVLTAMALCALLLVGSTVPALAWVPAAGGETGTEIRTSIPDESPPPEPPESPTEGESNSPPGETGTSSISEKGTEGQDQEGGSGNLDVEKMQSDYLWDTMAVQMPQLTVPKFELPRLPDNTVQLNVDYELLKGSMALAGYGQTNELKNTELKGYTLDAVSKFESSFGFQWQDLKPTEPRLPDSVTAGEILKLGKEEREKAFSSVMNSELFQNVRNGMDTSKIFEEASKPLSAPGLQSFGSMQDILGRNSSSMADYFAGLSAGGLSDILGQAAANESELSGQKDALENQAGVAAGQLFKKYSDSLKDSQKMKEYQDLQDRFDKERAEKQADEDYWDGVQESYSSWDKFTQSFREALGVPEETNGAPGRNPGKRPKR